MLIALVLTALADDPSATPTPETAADTRPEPSIEARIDEAIVVRRRGDVAAAQALLVALEPLVPPETLAWYLYQRGICEELSYRPLDALEHYDRVIALGGSAALDAHFRRALVLEQMGLDEAAFDQIRALDRAKGLSEQDEITIALQRGITELASGRRTRGIRRIQQALDATEGTGGHTYLRAKARYALADALLDEAADLALRGPDRRVVRRLEARAQRMKAAEAQIVAIAELQEPEWVLASLVSLGDSYDALALDVALIAAPKKLSEEQADIYRAELTKKAQNVRAKAFHCYDQGVQLATRLAWESPRVQTLKDRRAKYAEL